MKKQCARPACETIFDDKEKRIRKYCSKECSKLAQIENITKHNADRKQRRLAGRTGKRCNVCNKPFTAKTTRQQKYCSPQCVGEGMNRAIERQRERRRLMKEANRGNVSVVS